MEEPREETIRKRAYEIWESEGFPEGREQDHWKRAEIECGSAIAGAGSVPKAEPKSRATRARSPKAKAAAPVEGQDAGGDAPAP